MDVLSDVLRVVRLSGAVFFTAEFTSPWAIQSPPSDSLAAMVLPEAECVSVFHVLVEGGCWVECGELPVVQMDSGDVVIFPHGDQHEMSSHKGAKATPSVLYCRKVGLRSCFNSATEAAGTSRGLFAVTSTATNVSIH
jgi:Cupin